MIRVQEIVHDCLVRRAIGFDLGRGQRRQEVLRQLVSTFIPPVLNRGNEGAYVAAVLIAVGRLLQQAEALLGARGTHVLAEELSQVLGQ